MKNILIENMNHTGEGIGKINNKIIFIEKSIKGDVVNIENIIKHKNYSTANIKEIVKKSKDRISPKCPYYKDCGGCQIMAMNYSNQLKYKKEKVINIFKKYGNIDINPNVIESNQFAYRNKIVLQVQNSKIGLFKNKSNKIVEIEECLLVSPKINEIIKVIKNNLKVNKITKIMIREAQEKLMVVFYGEIDRNKAINYLKDMASSIYINSKCIYGDNYLEDKLGNYKFNISKDSFFQVNHNQTIKLYDKVLEYLGTKQEKVLDLYCGIGTIGTYISIHCNHVLGIEINKSAIKDANLNKKLNKINNISFEHGDVGKLINSSMDYDTIIVDPPRSGLDKKTRNVLKKIETDKIIYVSCNPITLVRDINDLKDKYELIDLTLVDMFPNTYHVESICVLNKR